MNILVTGSNGQLGSELRELSGTTPQHTFIFTDIAELDITDAVAVGKTVKDSAIQLIINCAAYTAVDKAESEKETAMILNRDAVGIISREALKANIPLIHISTDYVFDGNGDHPYKETDQTCPQSVYGHSKLAGELEMLNSGVTGMIIRTSWLYSSFGHNFVKTILRLAKERDVLTIVNDQFGSPTYARDLALAILKIIPQLHLVKKTEIFHFANEGTTNWYDFAIAITDFAGLKCTIKPIPTKDFPTAAARPAYSVMSKEKIVSTFGFEIPQWKDSLRECMEKLLNKV